MQYYLAPYLGTGRHGNAYCPVSAKEAQGSIDLRPDCCVSDGYALVAHEARQADPRLVHLADALDEPSAALRQTLGSRLRLTAEASRLRDLLPELLITHAGGPSRWKPLLPTWTGRYEIWLGGLVWAVQTIRGGATYTESFNKADAATLGPDLTWTEVTGTAWGVTSNQATLQALSTESHARAEHDTQTSDQFAQVTVAAMAETAGVSAVAVALRFASAAATFYQWLVTKQNSGVRNEHGWGKFVAGTETYPLGTISAVDVTVGEVLRGEVDGGTLTGYKDATNLKQITDTSITGNTRAGLRGILVVAGATGAADTFSFGDLRSSGSLLLLGVGS